MDEGRGVISWSTEHDILDAEDADEQAFGSYCFFHPRTSGPIVTHLTVAQYDVAAIMFANHRDRFDAALPGVGVEVGDAPHGIVFHRYRRTSDPSEYYCTCLDGLVTPATPGIRATIVTAACAHLVAPH